MKRILLLSALALAFPAAALADDPPPAQSPTALCAAQKTAMTPDGFRSFYGTNANKANAWGKCVSKMAGTEAERRSTAQSTCAAERDDVGFAAAHGGKTFAQFYGTNGNGHGNGGGGNAFGKCVSAHATESVADVQSALVSAAKSCRAERAGGATAFASKYGTGPKRANAFGKCVSAKAKAGYDSRGRGAPGRPIGRPARSPSGRSGLLRRPVDRLRAAVLRSDLDPAWLRALGDRDRQRQDALLVRGLDPAAVERVAEQELAAERPLRPLLDDDLIALLGREPPLGGDREHVLVAGEVDRVGVHAGQVEVHEEPVVTPVRVHREAARRGGALCAGELLCEPVEVAEGSKRITDIGRFLLCLAVSLQFLPRAPPLNYIVPSQTTS